MQFQNRDIPALIRDLRDFRTQNGTVFAEHDHKGRYVVYSYGKHFPMAMYDGEQWRVNYDKYSRTTSKHQGYVRQGIQQRGDRHAQADTRGLCAMLGIL